MIGLYDLNKVLSSWRRSAVPKRFLALRKKFEFKLQIRSPLTRSMEN